MDKEMERIAGLLLADIPEKYQQRNAEAAKILAGSLLARGVAVRAWTPVAEQLPKFWPEKRRAVLVTMEDDKGQRFTTTAKYDENTGEWYEFNDRRFYDTRIFRVVAWMLKPDYYDLDRKEAK